MSKHIATLIPGDGIGPEVVEATRRILDATGVGISWELAYAGEGNIILWRRGERLTVSAYDLVVRWDPAPETIDPRVGNWYEVTRSNGARGWAKNLETTGERCTFVR
jgi:hypothetical protein